MKTTTKTGTSSTKKLLNSTEMLVKIAMMSALSYALMFIKVPFPVFIWLDIDIADLPGIITTFAYGPFAGVLVALFKNLLHMTVTTTGYVGELSNFLMAGTYALVAGVVYKCFKSKKGAVIACFAGAVSLIIASLLVNYFIMAPLFGLKEALPSLSLFGRTPTMTDYLLFGVLPFNIIKAGLTSVLTIVVYKPLSKIFFKKNFITGTTASQASETVQGDQPSIAQPANTNPTNLYDQQPKN